MQAWTGREGIRSLRLPDFMTAHEGGNVVSPTHRPLLLPRTNATNIPKMEDTKLPYCFALHISVYDTNYSARVVLHHVHGDDSFPRNVGSQIPVYTASQLRRTQNESSSLWKLHNLKLLLKKVHPRGRRETRL